LMYSYKNVCYDCGEFLDKNGKCQICFEDLCSEYKKCPSCGKDIGFNMEGQEVRSHHSESCSMTWDGEEFASPIEYLVT
jgi:hypothetical protein